MSPDSQARERLAFLKIDDATARDLSEFRPVLAAGIDDILERFYAYIRQQPQLGGMFGSPENLARVRAAQKAHWLALFEGRFDDAYAERVRRIGKAHERMNLEPRWYIGGYCFALNEIVALAVRHHRRKPERLAAVLQSINKAVLLDMDFAISIYIEEGKATFNRQLNTLADEFESTVKKVVDAVSHSAAGMRGTAQSMSATAEESNRQSVAVAAASVQATTNVQTVASAAEELSASITEISRQVAQSTKIAGQAVDDAERTNATVKSLAEAAQKIGDVVKLINDIAGQTNLLALNATIEAARAGDAGKGFAVVASEVKSLATQTAKATEDIAAQIGAIQTATQNSVQAIGGIGKVIGEINGIATTIASAVEEQGAATQEIARNVQQAAAGTQEVSANIEGVKEAAAETGRSADQVLDAAGKLAQHSTTLSAEVDSFLKKIRAA